jgi:hypothetical protein
MSRFSGWHMCWDKTMLPLRSEVLSVEKAKLFREIEPRLTVALWRYGSIEENNIELMNQKNCGGSLTSILGSNCSNTPASTHQNPLSSLIPARWRPNNPAYVVYANMFRKLPVFEMFRCVVHVHCSTLFPYHQMVFKFWRHEYYHLENSMCC